MAVGGTHYAGNHFQQEAGVNADAVPAEASYANVSPLAAQRGVSLARGRKRISEKKGPCSRWKQRAGSKHGMFFIPAVPRAHCGPSEGGDILFSEGLHQAAHTSTHTHTHMSAHAHTHTNTHQHHTRFYSWMKSINGSSERVARQWTQRPGRHANPGFPGLCHKKKLSYSSGSTIKNETLVCSDPP